MSTEKEKMINIISRLVSIGLYLDEKVGSLGNGIIATAMPRVATQQSTQAVISATQAAVLADSFLRIMRAGRRETALAAEKRAQQQLIDSDQAYQQT